MTQVFHGRFIQRNLRRKKLPRTNQGSKTNQGSNFLGGSFSNRDIVRNPIESVPSLYPGYGRLPIYAFSDTFELSFRIYGPRKYGALKKMQTWKYVVTTEITVGKSLLW